MAEEVPNIPVEPVAPPPETPVVPTPEPPKPEVVQAPEPPKIEVIQAPKPPKKWPFWAVLGVLVLGGAWFYFHHQPQVKSHPLSQPLKTEMVFKGSVYKIQKAIDEMFKDRPGKIFQPAPVHPAHFTLYWNGHKHPKEIKIFKNPVNENDVYVSCNHGPIGLSSVYTDWRGRPLEFIADFQIHIIPQGAKESLVKVLVVNPQVLVGKNYLDVQPTTAEENEILTIIKKKLKRSNP